MKTEQARVSLPGEIYRKGERWWWKVRLPGEKRLRDRSLRPLGERMGTTSRRVAEEVALAMWEAAVIAHARFGFMEDLRACGEMKAETHGRRHRPMNDTEARAGMEETGPPTLGVPDLPGLQDDIDLTSVGGDLFTFASRLLDSSGQEIADQVRCDCCGCTDFYEEYLMPIDSGQRLCPRCLHAFQQKVRQMDLCSV